MAHITLRRLDGVLSKSQRVDVIKIDVEGAELAVLKGAEQTIQREKPALVFEASAVTCEAAGHSVAALFEWLENLGYVLQSIGPAGELTPVIEDAEFSNILAQHSGGRTLLPRS